MATAVTVVLTMVALEPPVASAATLDVCPSSCTYSTIQGALGAAVGGDVIAVGDGQYVENITVTADVTIRGTGRTSVVVDGGGIGPTITVASGVATTVEGLSIIGGAASDGAGVTNEGTLTLRDVAVRNNTATDPTSSLADGGGIGTSGPLTILDSSVVGNTADRGGGIWSAGAPVVVERSLVAENVARNHGGGGVAIALSAASLTMTDSVVDGNRVLTPGTDQRGGAGIWASQGDVTLTDVDVTANASGYSGGGVYVSGSAAVVSITRSTIARNVTGTDRGVGGGGGLDAASSVDVFVTDSTISDNDALGSGGGIRARSTSTVVVTNSTISDNSSTGSGGGVLVEGGVTLDNVTVAGNAGRFAGGVAGYSRTPILRNTVVADNTATDASPDCGGDVFVDAGDVALVEDTASCTITGTGTVLTGTDPALGPLADNGGATATRLPGNGSPLIDAGASTLTTDQRGLPRPVGAGPDIGAVELQAAPAPLADLSVALTPDRVDTEAGLSEDLDVTVFNAGPNDATAVLVEVDFSGAVEPAGPLPAECILDPATTRVVCGLATLADGDLRTFTLPLLFPAGGEQTVLATVTADEEDPDPTNDEAFGVIRVLGGSGAGVAAVVGAGAGINEYGDALAGAPATLNVGASNLGPNVATDVAVDVALPTGWAVVGLDPRCTPTASGATVTCTFGDLARPIDPRFPTTRLAELVVLPDSTGDVVVTATTTATDPEPSDDTAMLAVDVRDVATDLAVTAGPSPDPVLLTYPRVQVASFTITADPNVSAAPSFVARTFSPGVRAISARGLDSSWTCTESIDAGIAEVRCQSDTASLPVDVEIPVTAETVGDRDVRLAARSGTAFDADTSNDAAIATLSWVEPPPMEVEAIEVNQAIQDWELSVDLYADRRTGVRVHIEDPLQSGVDVGGTLHATRNGVPLTPPSIAALNGTVDTRLDTRSSLDSSVNFLLPASWTTTGPVELRFEADVQSAFRSAVCAEPVGLPDCIVDLEFLPGEVIPFDAVAIPYTTDDVQQVRLTPSGSTPVEGTWRFSFGSQTSPPLAVDATNDEVQQAVVDLYPYTEDEVRVARALDPFTGEAVDGWRIFLATLTDEVPLAVADSSLIGGSASVSTVYNGGDTFAITYGEVADQLARIEANLPISGLDLRLVTFTTQERRPIPGFDANPLLEVYRVGQMVGCPGGCRPAELRVGGFMNGALGNYGAAGTNTGAVFSSFTGGLNGARTGYTRNVAAHELAHAYGQPHAPVELVEPEAEDGEEAPDPYKVGLCGAISPAIAADHPWIETIPRSANRRLALDGYTSEQWPTIGPLTEGRNREMWGLDTQYIASGGPLAVISPRWTPALMSYCDGFGQHKWIAANEYAGVHQGIVDDVVGVQRDDTVAERLIVSGVVDENGAVTFGPVVGAVGADVTEEAGPLQVALVDDGGDVVDAVDVAVRGEAHEALPGDVAVDVEAQVFSAVLDAATADVAALVVSRDGTEVARRTASATAPTVRVDTPTAATVATDGPLVVTWTAEDADGDDLRATVTYSRDGETWQQLALDLAGDRLSVPLARLGASDAARVRVTVSDGLRTASAVSEPFVVGNAPPTVEITSPADGATSASGAGALLEVFAFDAEDGVLRSDSATWTSDLDGELGVGDPLVLPAGTLRDGCHTITVALADGAGAVGTDTTLLGVGGPCDEAAAEGTLVVRQVAPATPDTEYVFDADATGPFTLADGQQRTLTAAGVVTLTQTPPEGTVTVVDCDDPSGGTVVDGVVPRATVDVGPGETVVCTFTTAPDDAPPSVTVDPAATTVQVGDAVTPITFTVVDDDSPAAALVLDVAGLPSGLSVASEDCVDAGGGTTCTVVVAGNAEGPPGSAAVTLTVSDGTSSSSATTTVTVAPEDAVLRLAGSNRTSVSIGPDEDGATLELVVRTTEAEPDLAAGTPGVTDLAGADVTIVLRAVGPGRDVSASSCRHRLLGDLDDQTRVTTCTFTDVPTNAYAVTAMAGGDFTGRAEDALVVYGLSDRSTRGAGEVAGPDGSTVRFGFTLSYTRKATKAKGAVVVVRTLPDGSQHVVRSNAIGGLTFGDRGDGTSWASFIGKATYAAPSEDPIGNHAFTVYAEDGARDRFWVQVRDRGGTIVPGASLPGTGVASAVPLDEGRITVSR